MKRLLLNLFLTLILLAGWGAGIFYLQYQKTLNAPLVAEGDGIITVKRGDTLATLNRELIRRGVISGSDWVLPLYARLNPQAANIKAGDYRIDENASLPSLINDITNGKVVVYSVTVIEGKTFKDLRDTLRQTAGLEHTLNNKTDAEVATLLGLQGNPEGWFLPETYQFNRGTTDLDMLKRMYDEMQRTLEKAWASRAEGLPLATPYEALILASIIEKETGVAAERPQISGVFTRRLQKNMLLQTDPTVIYGRLPRRPHPQTPANRHPLQHLHQQRPAADPYRPAWQSQHRSRTTSGRRRQPLLRRRRYRRPHLQRHLRRTPTSRR